MAYPTLTTFGGILLFVVLSTLCTLAHLSATVAVQMAGSFCGLIALWLLFSYLARTFPFLSGQLRQRPDSARDLGHLVQRFLPPLLVVGVAVGLLAPLLAGQMPLSHDHPVHLYKAWHFWDEMLLRGRLRGWSSYWFFGYPAEELYPIGPDLWVALFRMVTLGLFSWESTYGLAFIGVFALSAYAVYDFGRRHFGTVAGVVAALLWTLDQGDYREGGWSYTVDWAVWVQILAMAFALLALGRMQDLLERRRLRDYVVCGLLVGAALLCHPINMIVFGLGVPLYLLTRWLVAARPIGREIAMLGGVCGLGFLLASFWFLPMLARSAWTVSIGDLWRPLEQTVRGLLDGTVFANVWPYAVMLSAVGGVLGLLMRRWEVAFLLLFAALLLFVSSTTAFNELSLLSISKGFSKIQYQRLVTPAKASLYLLAGFAVAQLVVAVRAWPRQQNDQEQATPTAWPRQLALVALVALVFAPFVRPALLQFHHSYLRTLGSLALKRSIPYWHDYQTFLNWSAQQRANRKSFYRIAYELDRHNHLMMGAPAYNRTPYYKVGYTPAKLFKHVTETTEDEVYRALSVAYVVSLGPLNRPKLELAARFGSIWVYRFKDYQPARYTLTGPGRVEVKEFSEERIHLRLSGTSAQSRLKVHVANYARWRARLNGVNVPISEAPVYGNTYPMLMEVQAGDGDLIFAYVARGVDIVGSMLTLLGFTIVVLLLVAAREERLAATLQAKLGGVGRLVVRWAGWATLGAALLVSVVIAWRVARGGTGLLDDSLANNLSSARVTQVGQPCSTWQRGSWFCSERSWNYVGPTTGTFNGALLPCIWAHPVEQGPTVITFPAIELGRALVGNHGLADSAVDGFANGAPVTMEIRINGVLVDRLIRPNEKGWVGFRVDTSAYAGRRSELSLVVTTPHSGGRHYCFDAKLER